MHYGVDVCVLGEYAEPARVVELAQAAEAAGWEAVFVWDHLAFAWGTPSADPWVVLAAVAQATTRVRLGTAVTPLPRRRPAVLANTVATLDRLSGGRVILGAGLGGVPIEFTAFGESSDLRQRAEQLDEALDVLNGLWSGQPVAHDGGHYRIDTVTLSPLPLQRPRVPIWIGGGSRAARRRAARWDGWILGGDDAHGNMVVPPTQITAGIADIQRDRSGGGPFDVAVTGTSIGPHDPIFGGYAEAGVTWWLEHIHGQRASFTQLLARINDGPPTEISTP